MDFAQTFQAAAQTFLDVAQTFLAIAQTFLVVAQTFLDVAQTFLAVAQTILIEENTFLGIFTYISCSSRINNYYHSDILTVKQFFLLVKYRFSKTEFNFPNPLHEKDKGCGTLYCKAEISVRQFITAHFLF